MGVGGWNGLRRVKDCPGMDLTPGKADHPSTASQYETGKGLLASHQRCWKGTAAAMPSVYSGTWAARNSKKVYSLV